MEVTVHSLQESPLNRPDKPGSARGGLRPLLVLWMVASLLFLGPLQRLPAAAGPACEAAAAAHRHGPPEAAVAGKCCYQHGACGDLCRDICTMPPVPAAAGMGTAAAVSPGGLALPAYLISSKDFFPVPLNPPPISAFA